MLPVFLPGFRSAFSLTRAFTRNAMQCDAVEGDHETDGEEHDGRDPPGLFPDGLFRGVSVLISAFRRIADQA
jgi:hypothetical protein